MKWTTMALLTAILCACQDASVEQKRAEVGAKDRLGPYKVVPSNSGKFFFLEPVPGEPAAPANSNGAVPSQPSLARLNPPPPQTASSEEFPELDELDSSPKKILPTQGYPGPFNPKEWEKDYFVIPQGHASVIGGFTGNLDVQGGWDWGPIGANVNLNIEADNTRTINADCYLLVPRTYQSPDGKLCPVDKDPSSSKVTCGNPDQSIGATIICMISSIGIGTNTAISGGGGITVGSPVGPNASTTVTGGTIIGTDVSMPISSANQYTQVLVLPDFKADGKLNDTVSNNAENKPKVIGLIQDAAGELIEKWLEDMRPEDRKAVEVPIPIPQVQTGSTPCPNRPSVTPCTPDGKRRTSDDVRAECTAIANSYNNSTWFGWGTATLDHCVDVCMANTSNGLASSNCQWAESAKAAIYVPKPAPTPYYDYGPPF